MSRSSEVSRLHESLNWEWMDWREWAVDLLKDHSPDQVADSLADMGQQMNDLRKGMAAEARIIEAQTLSLSPRVLGKGRREIVMQQVRRMYGCALAKCAPRPYVRSPLSHGDYIKDISEKLEAVDG